MARLRAARLLLVVLVAVAAAGCYQDPEQAMAQEQMLTDLGDVLNQLVLQTSELTAQVDSLSQVIAKQDTAIYRMANVTGVPYTR
jgi:predicted Zn-dependent protease